MPPAEKKTSGKGKSDVLCSAQCGKASARSHLLEGLAEGRGARWYSGSTHGRWHLNVMSGMLLRALLEGPSGYSLGFDGSALAGRNLRLLVTCRSALELGFVDGLWDANDSL